MIQRFTLSRAIQRLLPAAALVVWLQPLHAQFSAPCSAMTKLGGAATVMVENGQVSIIKDGYEVPLCVGSPVNPKAVIVTGPDGYAKLQSEDGSTVEVFPSARVTFRADYPSWSDYVQVFMGRIRVMIDHHLGANPHRVSTPTAVISVRGTIFDVTNEDQENTTEVVVEEGEVRVDHRIHPSYVILHANESTRVYADAVIAKVADHGGAAKVALERLQQGLRDLLATHPGGVGGQGPVAVPGGGSTGGAQGDKRGGAGGTGGTTGTPGTPPAPGTPPPPGGGGGG